MYDPLFRFSCVWKILSQYKTLKFVVVMQQTVVKVQGNVFARQHRSEMSRVRGLVSSEEETEERVGVNAAGNPAGVKAPHPAGTL